MSVLMLNDERSWAYYMLDYLMISVSGLDKKACCIPSFVHYCLWKGSLGHVSKTDCDLIKMDYSTIATQPRTLASVPRSLSPPATPSRSSPPTLRALRGSSTPLFSPPSNSLLATWQSFWKKK